MRRSERAVTNFEEAVDILRRACTMRLGLHGEPYPYVVPLSFGLETRDETVTLYFHGAKEGFKHKLIERNPMVCVEADILYRYAAAGRNVTAEYESFIGFGKAVSVSSNEAIKGLDLILAHCGYSGFEYDHAVTDVTRVYKVVLDSYTGKRNLL